MRKQTLRALIVDDEVLIRQLTARALCSEGFSCDLAADGNEAQRKLDGGEYHLVVTDLCMPNRHGHALASELVQKPDRPLVVVLTALSDPRMTKDLLARGVDDVILKPVEYSSFAAKLRALVNRRVSRPPPKPEAARSENSSAADSAALNDPAANSQAAADFAAELAKVGVLLPLSQNMLEIAQLTKSSDCNSQRLAAAIQSDAALAVEILRLANSTYYNPGGGSIVELAEAIPRLGFRRIGELTLSMHARRLLKIGSLTWLDRNLAWRRTLAAGLAADSIVIQGQHAAIEEGLFFSATMHSFGRITLGLLFPKHYEAMAAVCRETRAALEHHEAKMFPLNHAAAMARILQSWSVPAELYQPLPYILDEFDAMARLAEPLRSKAELVKLAVLLGWIAAGPWEPWDLVELAPQKVLDRLRISDLAAVIDTVRIGLPSLAEIADGPSAADDRSGESQIPSAKQAIRYRRLAGDGYDQMATLLDGMNFVVGELADRESATRSGSTLVNCLEASPDQIAESTGSGAPKDSILIGGNLQIEQLASGIQAIRLPGSYASLRAAFESARI